MIKVNTCQITPDGAYIEINIGSTLVSTVFTKLHLYTSTSYKCENQALDLTHLYRGTNNKEALMIPLNDLGLNAMDLYFLVIENSDGETKTTVTGNLTHLVVDNLNALQNLKLEKNCKLSSNCSDLDNVLYAYTAINSLPLLLNADKFETAQGIIFSLNNSVITKCDKSLDIFAIFTEDNIVKYKYLENHV